MDQTDLPARAKVVVSGHYVMFVSRFGSPLFTCASNDDNWGGKWMKAKILEQQATVTNPRPTRAKQQLGKKQGENCGNTWVNQILQTHKMQAKLT